MAIVVVKFSKKGFTARVSENTADGVKFTGNFIFLSVTILPRRIRKKMRI